MSMPQTRKLAGEVADGHATGGYPVAETFSSGTLNAALSGSS